MKNGSKTPTTASVTYTFRVPESLLAEFKQLTQTDWETPSARLRRLMAEHVRASRKVAA